MIEDLQTLWREFHLGALLEAGSPEQFLVNLVLVGMLAGVAWVVWKAIARLF